MLAYLYLWREIRETAGGSFVFYRLFKYPWTFEIILEESYQQRKRLNFNSVCFYFFPEASGRASVSYGFDTVNKTEIQLASWTTTHYLVFLSCLERLCSLREKVSIRLDQSLWETFRGQFKANVRGFYCQIMCEWLKDKSLNRKLKTANERHYQLSFRFLSVIVFWVRTK